MPEIQDEDREIVASAKNRIYQMMAREAPLRETLEELVRVVEDVSRSGVRASILLLDEDGKHLRHGAAPSLPDSYNAAIDGLEIGPAAGSCGTAAFHDRDVVVFDIANDARWAGYHDLAVEHGLRACWSTPIHSGEGKVLGTFANYYDVVRDPSPVDLELTELITHTAAIAIEEDRKRR